MPDTSESSGPEVDNSIVGQTDNQIGSHPFPQSALLHREVHASHSHSNREEAEGVTQTLAPYVGEILDTPSLNAGSVAGGTLEYGAYGDMPSQRKPQAEKEIAYYLNTSYACQNAQYSLIAHFPLQSQELLAHLLHQAVKRREGEVFIPSRVMQRDITDCPWKTEDVWGPLHDAGYVEVSTYSFTEGKARTFTLTSTFWKDWDTSYSADARPTRQVSGGKRLRKGRRIYATRLSDDSGNRYAGLVSHTLKASKDNMRVTVDMDALQDLMQYREEEIENLPLGHPALPRLTERLRGDRQRMDTMKAQVPEVEEDGLLSYEVAYAVQDGSGRVTEIGGGVQGLTREAKDVALGGQADIFNYDLSSAHHAIAIAYAKAHGIDTTALEDFDRAAFMKLTGCLKREAKTLFYGVMNGAGVPTCPAHALAMRDGEDPRTVEATLEEIHAREGTPKDKLYEAAQCFLRPVQKTMKTIAHHYVHVFYDAHGTSGRHGKGLRGASGIIFYKDQYEGSDLRKAALCHLLQGTEAAVGHALIAQQDGRGYTVLSHEHDGVVTRGTISRQDIRDALHTVSVEAGFCVRSMRLILKPYHEEMPQHFIDHMGRRPSRGRRRPRTRKVSTPHTRSADHAQDTGDRCRYRTRDGRGHK